jgi:16S rRNA processing protein RimM
VQLVVGRIGRAHGLRGEVSVEVRTDDADRRYAPDVLVDTDPPERGPLTVVRSRWHSGRLLVMFAGVSDRAAAEALRGTLLVADSTTSVLSVDPEEYWDHELVGLSAGRPDGAPLGTVTEVLHLPGHDVLVVDHVGAEVLVPFVAAIVTEVDVARGRVVIDPPVGLFDAETGE